MLIFGLERFGNPVDWEWPPAWCEGWKREALERSAIGPSLGNPLERTLAIAALRMPFAGVAMLETLGVPRGFVGRMTGAGDVGRVRCLISADRLWHADESGRPHLAVAVRDEWGVLEDICAFSSDTPDEWALQRGATAMLGRDRFALARSGAADRLRLFATPLDWLRGEGDGICVLDWTKGVLAELRGLGPGVTIACESRAVADALAGHLRWTGLPRIEALRQAQGERELGVAA